jgi:type II secretory pathway pseudopilin PulG
VTLLELLVVLVLLGVVAALITAATSRHSYRRTGLGTAGAAGLLLLDAVMIGSAAAGTAAPGGPLAAAVLLSLARITFTLRSLRQGATR